jgi:hypothetical protein
MNPGAPEEAAKAAGTFMEIMRSQPLSLALVIMNLGLLAILYYENSQAHSDRNREMELLYENRKIATDALTKQSEMLAKCYPAPPSQQH